MGCSSWISAVVDFDGCTRVELFSFILDLGWEPNEMSLVVPPSGEPGDWVSIETTDRDALLQRLADSGEFCGIAGLQNATSGSWIMVTFDSKAKQITIHLNSGCPMHRSVPRAADPSWALDLLRQIQEAGDERRWFHHITFCADEPW
jgi:hypothetical protein